MEHLAQHFFSYFELHQALTPEQVDIALRLRYAVYCEELAYEDRHAFPDGRESDRYDPQSRHCYLLHKATGRAAGCFRLILSPDGVSQLPFEQVCDGHLEAGPLAPSTTARQHFGEISRLAVHSDFRRRAGEQTSPIGIAGDSDANPDSRHYPMVALGLFLGASALALNLGLERVYVMMEPRLARLLRSCGIVFTQVGEVIDYHGRRGPFVITGEALYRTLGGDTRELLETMREQLRQQ
ncbi:PEP-CTERM/exosortase system-associated acyltransferase [Permianibacter sp. IMCC34836]|uniref:PEP-CTERM/exosortase system-associated acyltransferase n=1 Tax=Permianibacter fluminis TaxID=2738515 RepID=UPI0015539867|nr:PEP-CTERM/exosortase system-associated acyltransferase [Permianibacter fluminis]NQD35620.1 PEP-CTERM/exosortase system-associated acyltransferase [Permianibacter fluminis]